MFDLLLLLLGVPVQLLGYPPPIIVHFLIGELVPNQVESLICGHFGIYSVDLYKLSGLNDYNSAPM